MEILDPSNLLVLRAGMGTAPREEFGDSLVLGADVQRLRVDL